MLRVIFVFVCFSFIQNIKSQGLDHRLGELLFTVKENSSLSTFEKEVEIMTSLGQYEISVVIDYPFSVYKFKFDYNTFDELRTLSLIRSLPSIAIAQQNHVITHRIIPNDPSFEEQWQYLQIGSTAGPEDADIDADEAWDIATGGLTPLGDRIVVCVIDDGLELDHADIIDNIWTNEEEIPDNGIDDDNNGYVDDVHGWNTYGNNGTLDNDAGHGTPVTGIVGAKGNNAIGVTGVNWDVDLMIVVGGGDEANALSSYAYPYYFRKLYNDTNGEQGAFVVSTNASWGTDFGNPDEAPLWCGFYDLLGEEGILSCGATINGNQDVDIVGDLPTACPSEFLIAVTNVGRDNFKVDNAGYGPINIDLGAYGDDTYNIRTGNNYGSFGGTSAASPHVAGVIALLYSAPCLDFAQLALLEPAAAALQARRYILEGVSANESLEEITGTDGVLNAHNALSAVIENCTGCNIVTNSAAIDSGLSTLDLAWDSNENHSAVNLRYRIEESTEWNEELNVSSPFVLQFLEQCTSYEVQFQSICQDGMTPFGNSKYFKTDGCCEFNEQPLFNVNATDLGILMNWEEVTIAETYKIEFKKSVDDAWIFLSETPLNEIEVSSLELCTAYDIRLSLTCDQGLGDTILIEQITTNCLACSSMNYCEDINLTTQFEWIDSVTIGAFQKISSASLSGYDKRLGSGLIQMKQGDTAAIELVPGFAGVTYQEYWKIWIDYNQDGTFDEETELAFDAGELSDQTVTGQINIPTSAALGITRLRVAMVYDNAPDPCISLEDLDDGEVEDYCIEILPGSVATFDPSIQSISVYPNPFDSYFIIRSEERIMDISMFDISGKEIILPAIRPNGDIQHMISMDIRPGLYFLKTKTKSGVFVQQIISK